MYDIEYFRAIQGMHGVHSRAEAEVRNAKERLRRELPKSINYEPDVIINGIRMPLVITSTRESDVCRIMSMPDDNFEIGDTVKYNNEHWLVTVKTTSTKIQCVGEMTMCNQLFRFQDHDGITHEYWGIYGESYQQRQMGSVIFEGVGKIFGYLPYNEHTKKIYTDQRFVMHEGFDKNGKPIPIVYKTVKVEPTNTKYGRNHIIALEMTRDVAQDNDSLSEMIANYDEVAANVKPNLTYAVCKIIGGEVVRAGGNTRVLTPQFLSKDVNVSSSVVPVWEYKFPDELKEYIRCDINEGRLSISVSDGAHIGSKITVILRDQEGLSTPCKKYIEVI